MSAALDFSSAHPGVPLSLVAGRSHYDEVIEAVLRAETSVWISTANLKGMMVEWRRGRYRSVLQDLDQLARSGVELRILHAGLPTRPFRAAFDKHPTLVERLELRLCTRVHFKAIIVDGRFLYLGSANWTGAGLGVKSTERRNFELGITTSDEGLLDQVQAYYEALWRGRACLKCKLRGECEFPLDLANRRS